MIKTLSIPQELEEFLAKNPDLSPSKLLQSKIIEIRDQRRIIFREVDSWKIAYRKLQNKLIEANETIDKLKGGSK